MNLNPQETHSLIWNVSRETVLSLQTKNGLDEIYNDVFKKFNLITLEEFKRYFFLFICLVFLLSGAVNILSFYLANKLTICLNFEWKNRIINNYFINYSKGFTCFCDCVKITIYVSSCKNKFIY